MPEAARADRFLRMLLVFSAAVPLALYAGVSWNLHGDRLEEGEEHVRQTVALLEENALRVFEAQQLIIDRVDQRIEGMSWDEIRESKAVHVFLRRAADVSPHVDGLWLIPPDGRTANSADLFPFPPIDATDRDYFRALEQRDELHFGEMIQGKTKGTLNFNVSRRRSPRDPFDGLILVTVSLQYFLSYWEKISPYPHHVAALVREDGELLARYPAVDSVPVRRSSQSPLLNAMARGDSGVFTASSSIDGSSRIYGFSRVGNQPVFVGFGVDRDDVLAPWRTDLIRHGLIALSASVLLSGISLLALRQNRRLGAAMASWRETAGRLGAEIDRRERAEDVVAEKERLLAEIGAATAQRKAILDNMLEGVVAYAANGDVIYSNRAAGRILHPASGAQPRLDRMAREGRIRAPDGTVLAEADCPLARILRGETIAQDDLRLVPRDGGEPIVCRFSGAPVLDEAGRVAGAVLTFADVTAEKADEERRALLMNELDHRVRNMLATIGAMVRLSGSGSAGKEDLIESLGGRVEAMTRTHSLLTRSSWRGAVLREIVSDEVRPYASPDRLAVEGRDEVMLAPQDAVNFALVMHELATNAAKYGAWSGAEGRVEISWTLVDGTSPGVRVVWRECGGPPVRAPARTGFGTSLIRAAFRREGAGVDLRYDPGGLVCEIRIPLRSAPALRPLATAGSAPVARPAGRLDGLSVLLVEDEPVVRMDLVDALEQAGAQVLGPAATLGGALRLLEDRVPEVAVLDINLDGENVAPLAEALVARDVPVVFTSGYRNLDQLPAGLRGLPLLQKPVRPEDLVAILAARTSPRVVAG